MAAIKKDKLVILCNISILVTGMLTFMGETSTFKILNSISDFKNVKHKVLKYYIQITLIFVYL